MIIAISGTPGTGKTEVSKILARKFNYSLITVNAFAKEHDIIIGRDEARSTEIIDEKKLRKASEKIPDNTIIEGHLAHYCKSNITIILRCNPTELKARLKNRNWKKEKIDENAEAEALDIILSESVSQKNNTYEIDTTTNTPEKTATDIKDIIDKPDTRKEHTPGHISWLENYVP